MSDLLTALREAVGEAHVLHGAGLDAYEIDWRKRYHGRALAVVRPATVAEVQTVMRIAHATRTPVVPQGGNTGLVGGGVPDASGTQILLSLQRLNRIRAVDPLNNTLTAEAGCVLASVQQAAADADRLFPLSLAAEGSCTLGGNLATNAGGTQVLRYGNARDLTLGVEAVLADGQLLQGLSGLRKDNTGYALSSLLVGSEGTLAVITAATVKLYPRPASTCTALLTLQTLDDAVQVLLRAQAALGPMLTACEVMNAFSRQLVARHHPDIHQPLPEAPWTMLLETQNPDAEAPARERFEAFLGSALEAGWIDDAALAESIGQARQMWHLREAIPLAQASEGLNLKHDIALPVSAIPTFCAEMDALLARELPAARLVNFGHLGDGNLHFNLQAPAGDDWRGFLEQHEAQVNGWVYDAVARHGGSISAEHGIGQLKQQVLPHYKDAAALDTFRALKQAFDPMKLLNPDRLLQGQAPAV